MHRMTPKPGLYTQFRKSYGRDGLHEGRRYIPIDVINKIVTKENIKTELGRTVKNQSLRAFLFNRLEKGLANQVENNNARRLFVILVHLKEPLDIKKLLVAGFTDEDLPLARVGEQLQSAVDPTKRLNLPHGWEEQTMDGFVEKQWLVLAPVFRSLGEHRTFPSECPLPFSTETHISVPGSNSVIFKAQVPQSHQEGFEIEAPDFQVAVKVFTVKEHFVKEQVNLSKIRSLKNNKHIVQNFETFSQGERSYIVFPWAEGGDLENFWTTNNPEKRTHRLALWCLDQMLGLVEAVRGLHQEMGGEGNCRHGDLKPRNILHFHTGGDYGILKIADFGISRIHNNATFDRLDPTTTRATSPSYEAPEALSTTDPRSRKYDIWSLGCIFLEFTIWLVYSWEAVQSFNDARKPESPGLGAQHWVHFYQSKNGTTEVHPEVIKEIANLKKDSRSKDGTALGDLLNIIEVNLLMIKVDERFNATELCERLGRIVNDAKSSKVYLFGLNNGTA